MSLGGLSHFANKNTRIPDTCMCRGHRSCYNPKCGILGLKEMRNNCEKRKFGFLLIIIFIIILAEEGQIYALSVFTSLLFPLSSRITRKRDRGEQESALLSFFSLSSFSYLDLIFFSCTNAWHGRPSLPSNVTIMRQSKWGSCSYLPLSILGVHGSTKHLGHCLYFKCLCVWHLYFIFLVLLTMF